MTFPVSVMVILLSWERFKSPEPFLFCGPTIGDLVSRLKSGAGPSLAAIQLVCGPQFGLPPLGLACLIRHLEKDDRVRIHELKVHAVPVTVTGCVPRRCGRQIDGAPARNSRAAEPQAIRKKTPFAYSSFDYPSLMGERFSWVRHGDHSDIRAVMFI